MDRKGDGGGSEVVIWKERGGEGERGGFWVILLGREREQEGEREGERGRDSTEVIHACN